MKVLLLARTLDETNGWGRYAAGFAAQARKRLGEDGVIMVNPETPKAAAAWMKGIARAGFLALKHRKAAADCGLIHALAEPMAPLAMFLSMLSGKPYLVSLHGTYADLAAYPPALRWFYRLAFSRAKALVAVSNYTAAVAKTSAPSARIEVVPGGFAPRPAPALRDAPSPERRILSVGALKPRKGFHTLVDAMKILRGGGFGARLDIVGPTDEKEGYVRRIEDKIREGKLEKSVTIHGKIPQDELARLYDAADLFVLASEHDGAAFEGLGLVYLEALSRGAPAIGSEDSGADDVILDGENGLLVPPGDPKQLATAIKDILGDAEVWRSMSLDGPRSVEAFRWDAVGERMAALYRDLTA